MRIVLAAPAGSSRERLLRFLEPRAELHLLERPSGLPPSELVLEDQRVLLGEVELQGADALIVTDSGTMWGLPELQPSAEQWAQGPAQLQELLRDERERRSLWTSALGMMEDQLPVCVNGAQAFAMEAMKPMALATLAAAGLELVPWLLSDEPERLGAFATEHPGPLRVVPLRSEQPARWLEPGTELHPEEPLLLQSARPEGLRVLVAGEARVPLAGSGLSEELDRSAQQAAALLGLGLGELLFLPGPGGLALADFSPRPALQDWPEEASSRALEGPWEALLARGER